MRTIHLLLFGILFFFLCSSDEDPLQKRVLDRLANYNRVLPQEKVYLHLDKPYYQPGDTIWLKGYLVDAINNLPDQASKVLYVDLIDEEHGKALISKTLKVDSGFTSGNIDLPNLLRDGNYQLRAYTNWMRNFPSSFFFKKGIRIYKDIDRTYSEENLVQLTSLADIQFFPEGGDMINGLTSRIAFKAVNIAGKGIDVAGFVLNNKNDTISIFRSSHLGMGYFDFKPINGQTYKAYARDARGLIKSFLLPKPLDQGFVMATDNISHGAEVKLFITHNFTDKKNITVIAHQRGIVRYAADITDAKSSFFLRIPKAKFPGDGVVHFTLFDEKGMPRCERLLYFNNDKALRTEIKTDKKEYKPREKIQMDIVIKDASGKPIEGNFSIAVTDENQIIHEPYGENIETYLQLSSDVSSLNTSDPEVASLIEQPAYYFDKANSKGPTYLDILLMTQGWRRFTWSDVLNKTTYDTTFAIEPGISLSGRVTLQNGKTLNESMRQNFIISSNSNQSQFIQTDTDKNGKFFLNDLSFYDSVTITGIQVQKEKKLKFIFDPVPTEPVIKQKGNSESLWVENSVLRNYLLQGRQAAEYRMANNTRMLNEVVIKGTRIEKVDTRKTMMSHTLNSTVLRVSPTSCASAISAFQLLQAKVGGVQITGSGVNYRALIRGVTTFGGSEPLYLVDGMPVDATYINSITPCDIETIEVYKGGLPLFGSRGAGGAIAFYMRTANSPSESQWENSSKHARMVRMGYTAPREFYSPRYDQNLTVPDHRSTIYWQPSVITNSEGKATLIFWNSDETNTDIKAILEGMSFNGKIVSTNSTYSVQ